MTQPTSNRGVPLPISWDAVRSGNLGAAQNPGTSQTEETASRVNRTALSEILRRKAPNPPEGWESHEPTPKHGAVSKTY